MSLSVCSLSNDQSIQSRVYQLNYQKALRDQVSGILDQLHAKEFTTLQQYLDGCYKSGFVGTMYAIHGQGMPIVAPLKPKNMVRAVMTDSKLSESLYESIGQDTKELKRTVMAEISRGLSSGADWEEIGRSIQLDSGIPLRRALTIARTEGHRVQQEAAADARAEAKEKGCDVVKQWDSTLDGNTRESHRQLDGQIREVDEPFEVDGMKADYPGGFGDASMDCNCRCVALTRARWGLDEKELDTLKERAEFFGLDKKDSFKEFEEKYLKAAENVENTEEIGIIKRGNLELPIAKFSGYALNPEKSKDKATAFRLALGYTLENADELIDNVLEHTDESKFVEKSDKGWGMLYEYVMRITGANEKQANVLTSWIQNGKTKRLTSIYVTDKEATE